MIFFLVHIEIIMGVLIIHTQERFAMGVNTKIEWATHSWNPWTGCTKIDPGCKHCYMDRWALRADRDPKVIKRASRPTFNAPLKWARGILTFKDAAGPVDTVKANDLIFTCSLSDFYHEDADGWREEAFKIIEATPFQYLILTKRPERILDWHGVDAWPVGFMPLLTRPIPSNVWLGVSVSDTKGLWRLDELANIPAAIRWISFEPLLSRIRFTQEQLEKLTIAIEWIVTGGESGAGCRSFDPKDALALINYFKHQLGIACYHKQNGGTKKINGTWGGNELHGKTYKDYPEFNPVQTSKQVNLF